MSWAMVIVLCTAATGALLVLVGLIGRRIPLLPRCRKCGFDLTGLIAPSAEAGEEEARPPVCPECGSPMNEPRAVTRRRRKRWPMVAAFGLFLLVGGGAVGGYLASRVFMGNGWQYRVPGWWLAEIEVRFDSGSRLDEACYGIVAGRQVSPAWRDRASVIAFGRLEKEHPPASVAGNPSPIFSLGEYAAGKGLVSKERTLRLIRRYASVVVSPKAPYSPGDFRADYLPHGWRFEYVWHVENKDREVIGGWSGSGFYSNTALGISSGESQNFVGEPPHPAWFVWKITLTHGSDQGVEWTHEHMVE